MNLCVYMCLKNVAEDCHCKPKFLETKVEKLYLHTCVSMFLFGFA